MGQMLTIVGDLSEKIAALLSARKTGGHTLTLKVKYADFQNMTRSVSREQPFEKAGDILAVAEGLLKKTAAGEKAVRLLGVTVSHLTMDIPAGEPLQLELPLA
jgi:DNA polymerase-4